MCGAIGAAVCEWSRCRAAARPVCVCGGSTGSHPPGWPGQAGPSYLIPMAVSAGLSLCPLFAVFSFRSRDRAHLEWEGDTVCGPGTGVANLRRVPDCGHFSCPSFSQGLGTAILAGPVAAV